MKPENQMSENQINDDFLQKHQVRPDAVFVENLYQKLEQPQIRRNTMTLGQLGIKLRHKFALTFILVCAALSVLGFSSPVREAVFSWWEPNNEHLAINDQIKLEPIAVSTTSNSDFNSNQNENINLIDHLNPFPKPESTSQVENIIIEHFHISESVDTDSNMITLNWKVSGPGKFSLYWRPESEITVITSGIEGEYQTGLKLPETPLDRAPINLSVTGENGNRSQQTLYLSTISSTEANSNAALNSEPEKIPYDQLAVRFPDFNLPINIPSGYTLSADSFSIIGTDGGDNSLSIAWFKGTKYISYARGTDFLSQKNGNEYLIDEQGRISNTDITASDQGEYVAPRFMVLHAENGEVIGNQFVGRFDGLDHSIFTNDLSISKEELLLMLPDQLRTTPTP